MYYTVLDSNNEVFAFTASLQGARDTARLLNGTYHETTQEELEME